MRIVHVGHGRLPIPPTHWGAVEAIISDYRFWCERYGHEFCVVNEKSPEDAVQLAFGLRPDVIHLHDETKIDAFSQLDVPVKIVTTHDPTFFEKPNPFIPRFVRGDFLIGGLSDAQRREFSARGVSDDRLIPVPNGARSDLIRFDPEPGFPDRLICLGMIGQRKRQNLLFPLNFVDCVGPLATYDPVEWTDAPKGWILPGWLKQEVYDKLTDYAALVLLSRSEAAPLVVMEALMAGLDVIVSEAAAANLDRSQPFVHVLDEHTINSPMALSIALRSINPQNRQAVRSYAEKYFDWSVLTKAYLSKLWNLVRRKTQQTVDTV